MATKVQEIIADRLIKKIEESIETGCPLPWQQPWVGKKFPRSYETGRPYSGVNLLLLPPGTYITEKKMKYLQRNKECGLIKKGAKSHILYKFFIKEDEKVDKDGEIVAKKRLCSSYERVFNIDDIHDLKAKFEFEEDVAFEHEPIEVAESVVIDYVERENLALQHKKQNKAYYSPQNDVVVLPEVEQFKDINEYYSTKFHELVHSTGHENRLDRLTKGAKFGSQVYSKEELVAEIGSYLLCGHCNIVTDHSEKNSINYLRGWLSAIKGDISIILDATAKAQKAVSLILNNEKEELSVE